MRSTPAGGPTARFWAALESGRFQFQHCRRCDRPFHRPRVLCPGCGSGDWHWRDSAGAGEVYSVTTVHRPPAGFTDQAPYGLVLVDLDEGVRAFGRVVGPVPGIGDRVALVPDRDPSGAARVAFTAVAR